MGLGNPKPAVQPNWHRPNSVSGLTKTQYYRTEGLKTKMMKEGDLIFFQRAVLAKLKKYGMDTISYLPNPALPLLLLSGANWELTNIMTTECGETN